ncbi:hypothetical protein [Pontibacter rugosus]
MKTLPAAMELETTGYKEGKQTDKKTYVYQEGGHFLAFEANQ